MESTLLIRNCFKHRSLTVFENVYNSLSLKCIRDLKLQQIAFFAHQVMTNGDSTKECTAGHDVHITDPRYNTNLAAGSSSLWSSSSSSDISHALSLRSMLFTSSLSCFRTVNPCPLRKFSTCAKLCKEQRVKILNAELPRPPLGDNYSAKRNVGRSSRNNDVNDNTINLYEKCKLRDRTKQLVKGRVTRLKSSLNVGNMRLRDRLKAQRWKSVLTVGRLKKKFVKKENVKTIPNLLTTLRMVSAPVLAYLVVHDYFGLACSIFIFAGITDLLDGYIARNFKNQRTALGTALDPLADKLLISFLTVSLTSVGLIPVPMTVLILSRDAGLIVSSFYIRYISLAPPRTLARYFDVSHVTAKLYPSTISKINTGLQLLYVASTLASPVFDFAGHPLLQGLMYTTAATTFLSGADYVLTWRRRLKIIKNN